MKVLRLLIGSALACVVAAGQVSAAEAGVRVKVSGPHAPKLEVASACFTATGPDRRSYRIYGRRFSVGRPSADAPAILLVHGVGSSANDWDFTPRWSVARWLAYTGYVVVAYDRLGYRRSPYAGDPGGLTNAAQQSVVHDLVAELHSGSYRVGSATGTCRPSDPSARTSYASKAVTIVGHSAGGLIVSSYPGRYHDVAAMIQANSASGLFSLDPLGNAGLLSATAPEAHGAMDDKYGPIGDTSGDRPAPPAPEGYAYSGRVPSRAGCEEFNLWRPTAVRDVATVMCNPANRTATPTAERNSDILFGLENNALIPNTGAIPVLLAGADHDANMPGDANALELSAWRELCRCDVSQFILKDTAHAFMGHRSLVEWMTRVVRWLRQKKLESRIPYRVMPDAFPPRACGPVRVAIRLGRAGRTATRITVRTGRTTHRFAGPRRKITLVLRDRDTHRSRLRIRIRRRDGSVSTLRRTIHNCRALS